MKKISKLLSFVLRHNPGALGLEMDPNGWVKVDELILSIKEHNGLVVSQEDIEEIVETNDKKRFVLSQDGKTIRAAQGHSKSLNINLELEEKMPPEFLFHGTVNKFRKDIEKSGLLKMSRDHVHLSSEIDTAIKVGRRRGRAIILRINSGSMHLDGYKFYLSDNGVWLTDHVPVEYIEF